MGASLRDAFYRLLTIDKFEDFASKRFPDGVDKVEQVEKRADYAYDSAEHLHDVMHLFCGGFPTPRDKKGNALIGHMSHVPMAAFDPIFWLHHW
jgi:tyrosinase